MITRDIDGWSIAAKSVRVTLLAIVAVPMLSALYLGFIHAVEWLKVGKWPQYSTTNLFLDWGITYPKVAWRGVQVIIDAIMSAPAAWSLLGAAVVFGLIFGRFFDD